MEAADAGGRETGTTGSVEVDGLTIHYDERGEGAPVVLLHGGLATAGIMWNEHALALSRRHRLLMPDSRGHGRTGNPAGTLSYARMADDVAGFLAALGLERPAVVGYSDGAQIALELALRHPGVAGALVIGGAVTGPSEPYLEGVRAMGFPAPGEVDMARLEHAMGDFFPAITTAHRHAAGPEALRAFLRQISALWLNVPAYDDAALAGIDTPALVITGDRDELAGLDEPLRLYRLLPRAELAVIPGQGHGAAASPLFWTAVADFLSRHGGSDAA